MADREKVIKAIDICLGNGRCSDCGYHASEDCDGRMLYDVLDLLKEQEPVKPIPTGIEPNYNCGACKMPITQGYPFCPWCGRKVLWDG